MASRLWSLPAVQRACRTTLTGSLRSRFAVNAMSRATASTFGRGAASEAEAAASLTQIDERPESAAYFTGQPVYNDLLSNLDLLWDVARRQHALQQSTTSQSAEEAAAAASTASVSWLSRGRMNRLLGLELSALQHRRIVEKLTRLWQLPNLPHLIPGAMSDLQTFCRPTVQKQVSDNDQVLDRFGRAYAYGWRKEASARVWMVKSTDPAAGQVMVNGSILAERFMFMQDRESVMKPLLVTNRLGQYNVWCMVKGGGTTGQAEATRLAIARALVLHEPDMKRSLRKAGLYSHDPRVVERKKPGQPKARKKYTWVKR